ncbi:unnamed protein product [Thelazia callipaeda]|uniref:Uncharacterized protein n=1 Tax=Thelazia callipaeda TaxID=103827 RepID=A0A0N5CX85_THECL|nr:unnamed protein product [Thelazia callipaeda]
MSNTALFGLRSGMSGMSSATPTDFDRSGNGPLANSTPKAESPTSHPTTNFEEKAIVRFDFRL